MKKALNILLIIMALPSCSMEEGDSIAEESLNNSPNNKEEPKKPKVSYSSMIDERDGVEYNIAQIGGETWMAENLTYSQFAGLEGWEFNHAKDLVRKGKILEDRGELLKYYPNYFGYHSSKLACPKGWRLPSLKEYENMFSYLNGDIEGLFAPVPYSKNRCYNDAVENSYKMNIYPAPSTVKNSDLCKFDYANAKFIGTEHKLVLTGPNKLNEPKSNLFTAQMKKNISFSNPRNSNYCVRCIKEKKDTLIVHERAGELRDVRFYDDSPPKIIIADARGFVFAFYLEGNHVDLSLLADKERLEKFRSGEFNFNRDERLYSRGATSIKNGEFKRGMKCEVIWSPEVNEDGEAYPSIIQLTLDYKTIASIYENEIDKDYLNRLTKEDTVINAHYKGSEINGSCITFFEDEHGNSLEFYDAYLSIYDYKDGQCGIDEMWQESKFELTCYKGKKTIYIEEVGETKHEGWILKDIESK